MRDHLYYRKQADGCRRLLAQVSDPKLGRDIEALARRYDTLAAFWSPELVDGS